MPIVLPAVKAFAFDAVPLKVPVMVPVEKSPLLSLLTIVLGVLSDVAESTFDDTVVIVDELTPPTLFTVGASAEPPKSFVNFKIPFTNAVASGADEFVIKFTTKPYDIDGEAFSYSINLNSFDKEFIYKGFATSLTDEEEPIEVKCELFENKRAYHLYGTWIEYDMVYTWWAKIDKAKNKHV